MYHANFKFKTIRNSNDDTKINIFFLILTFLDKKKLDMT